MILGESQQFASPEEALEHFGVKGMHWGVRKERAKNLRGLIVKPIVRTTENGDKLTVTARSPSRLNKALAFASESYAKNYSTGAYLSIHDKDGKKIGEGDIWTVKDSLYVNWITVDKSARGHGYASEVMRAAEDHARSMGMKRMTLEVPGKSPDARHIYEKQGFKATKEADPREADPKSPHYDPMWGGLTEMEKRFDD